MFSWILPVKNEAKSLPQLFQEIRTTMQSRNFEIVAIDDASTDSSYKVIKKLSGTFRNLKIVHFPTHQGKWVALAKGMSLSRGDVIITIDSDLQDDPSQVYKLLNKFNQGYDLVSGSRFPRFDVFYKNTLSQLGNRLVGVFGLGHFRDLNSPFKVYRREVLERIPKAGSLLRFSLIFAKNQGYKVAEVPIKHRPRLYGHSKFGLVKYLRIIYDLVLITLLFSGSSHLSKNPLKKNY